MKNGLCTVIGTVGGFIASLFGGWDTALATLLIFMAVDYVTGLIVAGVFHKSQKTESGALESRAGWKGLCRKGTSLLVVLVAYRLDLVIGSNFVKDATIIAFIANETISIIENAGLMGAPIPAVIVKAIDVLKQKADDSQEEIMQATGSDIERKIWNFLRCRGLSPAGAAGLMGNLYAESALHPMNMQNSVEKKLGKKEVK